MRDASFVFGVEWSNMNFSDWKSTFNLRNRVWIGATHDAATRTRHPW